MRSSSSNIESFLGKLNSFGVPDLNFEVFEDQFFGQMRTPFEEPLPDCLEERQDIRIAQ
jgi:hypothetical protein